MKVPTKDELYAQVKALEKENIKLQEQLDAEKQKRWLEHQGRAKRVLYESVPFTVLQIHKLRLDHVDSTGYWFVFVAEPDNSTQTYCVRHTDIEETNYDD